MMTPHLFFTVRTDVSALALLQRYSNFHVSFSGRGRVFCIKKIGREKKRMRRAMSWICGAGRILKKIL